MKFALISLFACIICCPYVLAGQARIDDPALWIGRAEDDQPIVQYSIQAELLANERRLTGWEELTFVNSSLKALDELQFHLYFNAYRDPNSTFFSEQGLFRKTPNEIKKLRFGDITITDMRVMEGEELTSKIQYIAPDDANAHDRTVIRVPLQQPLLAGERVRLKIAFTLTIPQIFARSGGSADNYFFFGQWFPKIGVLQKDGTWNCHQYHSNSEFFADYGDYTVKLTVPQNFIIGASGHQVSQSKTTSNTISYTFRERKIHDFAWVAYPHFQKITKTRRLKGNSRDTTMILLLAPGHQQFAERYIQALTFAMEYYADTLFPYPYETITLVDPPKNGIKSAGMEYPTLITAGAMSLLPAGIRLPELVTIHEFGHQYWYGMIGNNEGEEAWLDEGINSYFELDIITRYFNNNSSLLHSFLLDCDDFEFQYLAAASLLPLDKINTFAWKFMEDYYAPIVYSKTSMFLTSLKGLIGKDKMNDFFKFFALKFRYGHPTSNDFCSVFNAFMGSDYSWAFDQFINGETQLDQAVLDVQATKISSKPLLYRNEAVFARISGYFPVPLLLKLKNGKEIRYFWQEKEKWKKMVFNDASPLEMAALDPDYTVPLDTNFFNNSKVCDPNVSGFKKLAIVLTTWFSTILQLFEF